MTAPAAKLRYVILHHTAVPQPHSDLMIESEPGGDLMTWRCAAWPIERQAQLTQLGPHRRAYLEYQGPVSAGRGHVRRIASGYCHISPSSPEELAVSFDDGAIVHLHRVEKDQWIATMRKD